MALSQSVNTTFGKNRVQHHDDFKSWWMYETKNFITYWYGKSKNVAKPTIQIAEMDHDEIQNIMEHRFNDKIEIIVYLDVSDIKQSNIGLEETFISDHKETKIEGNKMFVYFNGDHNHLRLQIRRGIAAIYLKSILVGVNLQEIVQNAVLLNLPDWYKKGLVAYIGEYWNIESDDELRDILNRKDGKYYDFEKLAKDYPKIAGHSFWYYMDQNFGKSSISNVLYLTKINRNLETSFIYVLSQEFEEVVEGWKNFYQKNYTSEKDRFNGDDEAEIELKNKPHQPISHMRISPDGTKMIYVYNDLGKYSVVLRNLSDESEQVLFKKGSKNKFQETDYDYPIVEWNPNGVQVSILYEDRDILKLRKVYLADESFEEQTIPEKIERIYSMSYRDGTDFVLSASDNGFSDLFSYTWKTRQFKKITDDFYDDLDAVVTNYNGQKGILFSSNRESNLIEKAKLDTILPLNKFDIFFLPFEAEVAKRITYSPKINERFPFPFSTNQISFISEQSGIKNRFSKVISSDGNGISTSNLDRNIIRHHSVRNNELSVYTLYKDGSYKGYLGFIDTNNTVSAAPTAFRKSTFPITQTLVVKPPEQEKVMEDGFLFITEFEDPQQIERINTIEERQPFLDLEVTEVETEKNYEDVDPFINARAIAARLRFKIIDLSSGFDNAVLFEGLESYIGDDRELVNQPLAIRFKGIVKDLFEDYRLELGARYPTSLNGSEYYVMLEDNKKLIDKKYALYRKSKSVNEVFGVVPSRSDKRVSLIGLSQFKYPLDIYRSLRATGTLRFDRLYSKVADLQELESPFAEEKRIGLRVEYVYDNTLDVDLNIINGTRYKFYVEALNRFNLQIEDGFNFDASTGFTTIVGGDARHYLSFGKWSVLALRASAATSLGNNKMIYYLGGMESAMFANFNNNIPIPDNEEFAYKALAPHLRGFDHNIRNGSSYILFNTELRVPVIRHIFGNVRNGFLRNMMLTSFFDAGTAWHGTSPYSEENPLNTVYVENNNVQITAHYFRDPIVMGFGFGARTTVLGYYIKADYGWGLETRGLQSPKLHFSLGMDF